MAAVSLTDALFPFLLRDFANILAGSPSENSVNSLQNILIQLCVLYVFFWLAWRIIEFSIVRFGSQSMRDLEKRCFDSMQQHSFEFFQENFSGSLVKKIGRFVRSFEAIFDWIFFTLLLQGLGGDYHFCYFCNLRTSFCFFLRDLDISFHRRKRLVFSLETKI